MIIYTMIVIMLFVLVMFLANYWLIALVLGVILVLLTTPLALIVERFSHGHQLPKNGLRFGLIVCGLAFLLPTGKVISLGTFALLVVGSGYLLLKHA